MSKLNKNLNNLNLHKSSTSQIGSLFPEESEEDYLKSIEESNENFRRLQEKKQKNNSSLNNSEEEEDDEEDEDEDEDEFSDDSDIELNEEQKSGLINLAKNLLKKVGVKSLVTTGATFGSVGLGGILLIGMYRIHYTGEFEFKGISGEYQTTSFKKMNFTSFNKSGDVQLGGLTKENKLTKAYYTLYSDNSYYAVVEDSSKYSNIDDAYKRENLLTPEELREEYPDIQDTEGREKMFQLNPDVLYSLDRYLHKNQFLYPQQFVKPVYYEESKDNFKLKELVKDGKVVAKSQVFNKDGTPAKNSNGSLKKETGIWDYGLASVLHYKEYEVKEKTTTNVSGISMTYKGLSNDSPTDVSSANKDLPKVGAEVSKTLKGTKPASEHPNKSSGTSAETVRDEPAYAIEKAVTAGGTISGKVAQKWQEKEGSRKTETLIDTIKEVELIEVETQDDLDGDGKFDIIQKELTHIYEVTYTYESYTEEYVPYYEGDLDTSEIIGSKYYRQYIRNYSNYIPENVPKQLDYSVLENEEVSSIFVDDDPNAYGSGYSNSVTSTSVTATEEEFNKAVFMGDSITLGLSLYNVVDSDRVVAVKGDTVSKGLKQVDKVISKKPPIVIIGYGTNDAGSKNTDTYVKDYKSLITKLKTGLPDAKIFLNKTFLTNVSPSKDNIPSFNNALQQIASETGVTIIDCSNINSSKDYHEKDGIHFKKEFYKLWLDEIKKNVVGGTSSSGSDSGSSSGSNSGSDSGSNSGSDLGSNSGSSSNIEGVQLPRPTPGESRSLSDIIKLGVDKEDSCSIKSLKYLNIFEKYGKMYGVDPYILVAMGAGESCGNPDAGKGKVDNPSRQDGAKGILQIEDVVKSVTAYNHETKTEETVKINWNDDSLNNVDWGIKIGAMQLAQNMALYDYNNILAGLTSYNPGPGGIKVIVQYYLSGGVSKKVDSKAVMAYLKSNHIGWITALYPGDLPAEKTSYALYKDPNDGFHDARTWYRQNKQLGVAHYIEKAMRFYAGNGSPWIMKPDGTVVTIDGGMASGYTGGSASAISAFNSYLASNWQTILDNKEILYPWSKKLDKLLENDKKADYTNKKAGDLPTRQTSLFISNLTSADEDIVLNMMFALNQGNYLAKYDYMGEAEWKAMYNQLLSSPTGKTWDDKWIGFTPEEVFGKSLDDLGKLFEDGNGINPTISRSFGKLKNIYSDDDINTLPQYNEMNFGVDLSVPKDTNVLALEDGEIIAVSKNNNILGRYGNYVQIKFNNNTKMIIANLKNIDKKIKKGKTVLKGEVLGVTGGDSKSYKDGDLHIELLYKGEFINPEWIITRDMNGFDDPIQGNVGAGGTICEGETSTQGVGVEYVDIAIKQVGKPYVYGSTGPNSFDCSGLVYYSMNQAGITGMPRNSREQRKATQKISKDELQVGDLIFRHGTWDSPGDTNNPEAVTHVMIYIGNNKYVHAPRPGKNVEIKDFKEEAGFSYGRYSKVSSGTTSNSTSMSSPNCQTPNETMLNGGMKIPLMLQTDSRWANHPYGAGNSRGNNIKNNGCSPSVLSMVISYMTQTTVTPPDVADWAGRKYYVPGQGTAWNIYDDAPKKWGFKSKKISNKDSQKIIEELKAGHPIIASMGPGAFTSGGHYIVLRGVTSDGKILVNDPNSKERSEKSWNITLIMGQSKAMWAFSK